MTTSCHTMPNPPPDMSAFGMMNALRTGDAFIDTAICMLIPVFLPIVMGFGDKSVELLKGFITKWFYYQYCCREIKLVVISSGYGWTDFEPLDNEEKNHVLQRALKLHIASLNIEILNSDISFVEQEAKYTLKKVTKADRLKRLKVAGMPSEDEWVKLGNGIDFKISYSRDDNNSSNNSRKTRTEVIYSLKAVNPGGEKKIDAFISEAMDAYVQQAVESEDNDRYLYIMQTRKRGDDDDDNKFRYKRYKLLEPPLAKTFDSLFFKEKARLMNVINMFQPPTGGPPTGKYGIPGYPHKLGLLLHGPPGTGKTSFIKALGQYTQRQIISIDLCKITTNQELMDIIFDQTFPVVQNGEYDYDFDGALQFKDVIFVMEDVDAATDIVLQRKSGDKKIDESTSLNSMQMIGDMMGTGVEKGVKKEKSKNDDKDDADEKEDDKKSSTSGDSGGGLGFGGLALEWSKKQDKDKLNLSGLLNVLDGIVDTPGRLLIMTSNHPEKLDSALTRPGRIDMIIKLDYMEPEECKLMLLHYFQQEMTEDDEMRLENILRHGNTEGLVVPGKVPQYTPAELEQLCIEYNCIKDFLSELDRRSKMFMEDDQNKFSKPGPVRQTLLGNSKLNTPIPSNPVSRHVSGHVYRVDGKVMPQENLLEEAASKLASLNENSCNFSLKSNIDDQ